MSVITVPKKHRFEIKLKLSKVLHSFDDFYIKIFPANHPGYYNNPLGHKKAERWNKSLDQKNKWYAMLAAYFIFPLGWYSLGVNSDSIWPVFFIIWGGLGVFSLVYRNDSHNQVQDKKIENNRNEIEKLKKENRFNDDPLKILKVRFAKGEISKEEYDEMKSALE